MSTANRSVAEPFGAILTRAKYIGKRPVSEIAWKMHLRAEPKERVRKAGPEEEAKLFAAMRPDFVPIVGAQEKSGVKRSRRQPPFGKLPFYH